MKKSVFLGRGRTILFIVTIMLGVMLGVGSLEVSAEEGSTSETTIKPSEPKTGDGTEDKPYQIGTAEELYWFAGLVNGTLDGVDMNTSAHADLTKDITVNTGVLDEDGEPASDDTSKYIKWIPIGTESDEFTGTFDGKNYTISGLYFNDKKVKFVGLIGYLGDEGRIVNVGIKDSYFKGDIGVGGVCGNNQNGLIENCYHTGNVGGYDFVGGVCGYNFNGVIQNCYNTGMVDGSKYVGGVCGYNSHGTIQNCYYNMKIKGVGDNDGKETEVVGKTTEQFASGEVAYLLQANQKDQEDQTKPVWGQTLAGENRQTSPVLGGKEVYKVKQYLGCINEPGEVTDGYSNKEGDTIYEPHRYENGICSFCRKAYQKAGLVEFDINNDGKKEEVYMISNAGQLYWFADKVNNENATYKNANAILIEDITVNTDVLDKAGNLNDTSKFIAWTPIGTGYKPFTGIFDGQKHTISGLYFNDETDYVGLFGCVKSGGKIANVGVLDSYFKGDSWIGGICGDNEEGVIETCYNEGIVSGSQQSVGGVCGDNGGTCKNSYNTGTVSGGSESNHIGGVCGKNTKLIESCYNTGAVSGSGFVGGVCGYGEKSTTTNSYNTGAVSGSNYVGGVCGGANHEGTTTTNCYNVGAVNGSENVGGVCGYNSRGTNTNCYNIGEVNGSENVGGVCGYNMQGTTTNCYNIGAVNGSKQVGGVCGDNYQGTITNCYYDSTVYNGKTIGEDEEGITSKNDGKTTEQFKSGEVAYLLQEGQTEPVWGQKIGTDSYPVFGGSKVYKKNKYSGCKENPGNVASDVYSNADNDEYAPHTDDGKAVGSVAYDNRCDFCGKELHSFNEDGSCKDAGCVYHKGSITNVSYPTKIVYSGDVANAEPKAGDFTVNSGQTLAFKWYQGDVTSGNLPTDSLSAAPKEAGTYTLVVKADGVEKDGVIYTVAERRVLVTIEKEPVKEEPTTQQPSGTTTSQPTEGSTVSQPPKNGDVITDDKTKAKFEVTDVTKKEVTYNAPADEKAKDITIPDTVTINGEVYKVTKIADNAFKGNKTVTTITIGSNIQMIGKNAFSGCKKLKTIIIKSKTLTDKKISKKAFKGISKKTVIKVPKKRLAAYKKLLKKKGLSSKNKVKGY